MRCYRQMKPLKPYQSIRTISKIEHDFGTLSPSWSMKPDQTYRIVRISRHLFNCVYIHNTRFETLLQKFSGLTFTSTGASNLTLVIPFPATHVLGIFYMKLFILNQRISLKLSYRNFLG